MSDIIKFDGEGNFLPTEPMEVLNTAGKFYTSQEIAKALEAIPDEQREVFKAHLYEASFWKRVEQRQAPFEMIKKRKGSKIQGTDEYYWYEYLPVDYTISELNRLFPGWWQEEMKLEVDKELRTVRCMGYLCVEYPTVNGKKVTKRWTSASTPIKLAKEPDEKTGVWVASQPDDLEKAAVTEWFKNVGKYYGIGIEIYHQRITPELRQFFEELIRPMGRHAETLRRIEATFTTGQGYRGFLQSLPTFDMIDRVVEALKVLPDVKNSTTGISLHEKVWGEFCKLRIDDTANRLNAEDYIRKVEAMVTKYRTEQSNNKTN